MDRLPVLDGRPWLDVSVVQNNTLLFGNGALTSVDLPGARELNYKTVEAKTNLLEMLDRVSSLAMGMEQWKSKIPNFPKSAQQIAEAEDYKKGATGVSSNAQTVAAKSKNAFDSVFNSTTSLQREIELKNNQATDELSQLRGEKETDWYSFKKEGMNVLLPEDLLISQFEAKWAPRLQGVEGRIRACSVAKTTCATFSMQSQTWQILCQTVLDYLGSVNAVLANLRLGVQEDPTIYKLLTNGQWKSLADNVNKARNCVNTA